MSVVAMLLSTLISASVAAPATGSSVVSSASPKAPAKGAPKKISRGIASLGTPAPAGAGGGACSDAACLCEEFRKLTLSCMESVNKISDESNRKQFRQLQADISSKRRQVTEQGKSCQSFNQADLCFERSVKNITEKSPRRRDVKNENTTELLGFGSDVMMKLGNQPGVRSPANNR